MTFAFIFLAGKARKAVKFLGPSVVSVVLHYCLKSLVLFYDFRWTQGKGRLLVSVDLYALIIKIRRRIDIIFCS